MKRHTASSITDDALDALYENANEGWRRGDRWKERAEDAEAAIERVKALAERWRYTGDRKEGPLRELRQALAQPEENSTK